MYKARLNLISAIATFMSACGDLLVTCTCQMCYSNGLTTPFCETHGNICDICERPVFTTKFMDMNNHCIPSKLCKICKKNQICRMCNVKGCYFCVECISCGKTGEEKVISPIFIKPSQMADNSLPKPGSGYAEFCRIHGKYSDCVDAIWNVAQAYVNDVYFVNDSLRPTNSFPVNPNLASILAGSRPSR